MMPIPGIYQKVAEGQQSQRKLGSVENPQKFKGQDFDDIREYCYSRRLLFEDDTFPANLSTIGPELLSKEKLNSIKWKRPNEIHRDPRFLVDGASIFDIVQGEIGDCWVLAAVGALTLHRKFLENVIPKNQEFKQKYAGIFHFRFWQFGDWVDVVIDDRLPFLNGRYLSVQPRSNNEFWPSLLEKAYAKLRGSYQNLHWGFISEALVDFTGGVQIQFILTNPPPDLRDIVKAAAKSASLMGSTTPGNQKSGNLELKNGIVQGHAYTVTDATQVEYKSSTEDLVRVWNPWGQGEWNGRWSDGSSQWQRIRPDIRNKLNVQSNDGEFWMSCQDFLQNFDQVSICNHTPAYLDFENPQHIWKMSTYFNHWVKGSTAGGANPSDIWKNPQHVIRVSESEGMKRCYTVSVALMQSLSNEHKYSPRWLPIGFLFCKVDSKGLKNGSQQKYSPQQVTETINSGLQRTREVTRSFMASPGTYVILPFTENKGQESEFLLRIFLKTEEIADEFSPSLSLNTPKSVLKRYQENSYEDTFAHYAKQSSEMDAEQLQRLLNDVVITDQTFIADRGAFALDTCRGILMLMDLNANGRLTLQEFGRLWKRLNMCKDIFRAIDVNQSGFLDGVGLRRAAQEAGLIVSEEVLNVMSLRYGNLSEKLNFSDFVCCMIRLETATSISEFNKGWERCVSKQRRVDTDLNVQLTSNAVSHCWWMLVRAIGSSKITLSHLKKNKRSFNKEIPQ